MRKCSVCEFDIDMELKGKDFVIEKYQEIVNGVLT